MKRTMVFLLLALFAVFSAGAVRVQINDVPGIISDLVVNDTTIFTPSATQVIDAVGDAILANATTVILNPDADYTLTSTPTIANGTTGQVVYIIAASGETKRVTIQDQDTLASSNLQLLSPMRTIYAKSTLVLEFNGTDWQEIGYVLDGSISEYNVKDFGGTGDGSTDDTAAIEAAIAAAPAGGTVIFPVGTYKVTSEISITKSISLVGAGMGSSVISGATLGAAAEIFDIHGAITGTTTTLTGDAATGQPDIAVTDASSFSADDWIRVRSEAFFNVGTDDWTKLAELKLIESIAVNTITCTEDLTDTYETADTATIDLVTMISNIRLEGLKFLGRDGSDYGYGVKIRQAENVLVKDCWFDDNYTQSLYLQDVVKFRVTGCLFEDSDRSAQGYGIIVGDMARDGSISGNNFVNCRHSVSTGGSGTYGVQQNVTIDGNTTRYTDLATRINAFVWHNSCKFIALSNNVVWGDGLVSLNGTDLAVSGNMSYQDVTSNPSITVDETAKRCVITDNIIHDTQNQGLKIDLNALDIIVSNNYIYTTSDDAIRVQNSGASAATERITINGNRIESTNNDGIRFLVYAQNIDHVNITDNIIKSGTIAINIDDNGAAAKVRFLQISGNLIADCTTGINLQGVQIFDISNNTINSASVDGIQVATGGAGCSDYTIRRNRFVACGTDIDDQVDTEDAVDFVDVNIDDVLAIGTTSARGVVDLGHAAGGKSLVWGGTTGTTLYGAIGTTYSSADLALLSVLELDTAADNIKYAFTGTYGPSGIRLDQSAGDIHFFTEASSANTAGDVFNWVTNTTMKLTGAGNILLTGNLTIGDNSDNDFSMTFDGDTSNGILNYDEDNADFEFNQDVATTGTLAGVTLNTGQGAYELFAMNQDVESTDAVTFAKATLGAVTFGSGTTTLSAAQVNACRVSPITVVAAQGANTWIELVSAVITYDFDTAAFTVAADEDLVIEYADGTDATASIETTGFLDQGDDEIRFFPNVLAAGADIEATINQALRIFNTGTGETADGGSSEVDVRITYRVYATGF